MLAWLLLTVPVCVAVFGPAVATNLHPPPGPPYAADGLLGTDGLGRDVLTQLLRGGGTLGVAVGAVALAYLVGGAIGLAAASNRVLDEVLMRPLDVLLPMPSLLVISVVVVWRPEAVVLAVAVLNVPTVARLVRAAALDAASSPVVEAMWLQGESLARVGFIGRSVLGPLKADVGTRVALAVFLVASANFLGLGLSPAAADWAVAISHNRQGLLLQSWAVLAPAGMIVAFTLGLSLLADRRTR
ncbi:ABC transporter permease [Lentzea tibetensis]|uniref:ABC transporter permease n=1 Tax=Lentzea tibetensis TaxID=2591470 RepID=UPI001F2A13B6|nr:ABC transporter permease subunit [Lentzea tibetensis]